MYSCIHDTTDVDIRTQCSYVILNHDADTQYTHTYMCHTQDTLLPPSFPSSSLHMVAIWYVVCDDMRVCSLMPTNGSTCAAKEGGDGR